VSVGGAKVDNVDDLLKQLFWKEPQLPAKARELLDYIKEWGRSETPYRVSQWGTYCTRNNLTQSQYHNILRRLRRAGLITKKYNKAVGDHELFLSDELAQQLDAMSAVWREYARI
jgi:hypothetical protein